MLADMFPDSRGFVAVPINSLYIYRDKMEHVSLIQLVTGIATKPSLSGNIFENIKICENRW